MSTKRRANSWLLSLPSLAWLVILFAVPTFLVLIISFKPATPNGGLGTGWTLQNWQDILNANYLAISWRTLWLSAAATAICLLLSLPVAYFISRLDRKWRNFALLLIILPFWTNFLIRIYAWKAMLHPDGFLQNSLAWLGIIESNQPLLYNVWSILLVLVYTYLPFAILPLYAAAEKFDFALLDAARDLGASKLKAYVSIFIPGVSKGLASALAIVLIPALGSFAIPDIVGGPGSEMIGNKIAQRVFADRNLPHASALSSLLALAIFIPFLARVAWQTARTRKEVS